MDHRMRTFKSLAELELENVASATSTGTMEDDDQPVQDTPPRSDSEESWSPSTAALSGRPAGGR
jgi:hypothetical protein